MLGIFAAEREPTAQIRYLVKNTLFLFNQKGFDKIYFSTKYCEKNYSHYS